MTFLDVIMISFNDLEDVSWYLTWIFSRRTVTIDNGEHLMMFITNLMYKWERQTKCILDKVKIMSIIKRARKADYDECEINAIVDGFTENNEIISLIVNNDVTQKKKQVMYKKS